MTTSKKLHRPIAISVSETKKFVNVFVTNLWMGVGTWVCVRPPPATPPPYTHTHTHLQSCHNFCNLWSIVSVVQRVDNRFPTLDDLINLVGDRIERPRTLNFLYTTHTHTHTQSLSLSRSLALSLSLSTRTLTYLVSWASCSFATLYPQERRALPPRHHRVMGRVPSGSCLGY